MHVGLNLVFLVPGETGGTEVYARELIPELVAAAPDVRFTAFVNREAAAVTDAPWGQLIPAITVPVQSRNRTEWVRGEQQLLPRLAAGAGVDVLHSLANTAPAWGRFLRVVTIQDLMYRLAPEAHLGVRGLGMRVLVPLAARSSHRIIAASNATSEDVRRLLHVQASKIDVVPHGVSPIGTSDRMPAAEVRARFGIRDGPMVLCVAAKRPHKNLMRLLGAIALISPQRRPTLVLPGYPTAHEDELAGRVGELGIADDVRLLGWIEPRELEGLYAAADCFVFPSLLEGFGLPVLEAMNRGVPVACSDRGALAEVAGDAALRFDPESEPAIAAAIERLLSDPQEAERLRQAGYAQAARFSWKASAAGTLTSYQRTIEAKRSRLRSARVG
jgi:glycosyltransferase involved in cell wall biosynthesis